MANLTVPPLRFQVFVDRHERPQKCTILPLMGHPALDIVRFERSGPLPALQADMLLHPDGEDLATVRVSGAPVLAAIDCNWQRLPGVLARLHESLPRLVRIPSGFVTAYPRRNKQDLDPETGLATIEALYVAGFLLGRADDSLLSRYHFAPQFLAMNAPLFKAYNRV